LPKLAKLEKGLTSLQHELDSIKIPTEAKLSEKLAKCRAEEEKKLRKAFNISGS